jgi:signal transduction histidine kinase
MVREWRGLRLAGVLRLGFGAALLLALSAGVLSIVEVERARRDVDSLVRTAERSTYLLSQIERHVSRMRTLAFDQLIEPERDDTIEDDELIASVTALESALRELQPLLQPSEIAAYEQALPLIERFRGEVASIVTAVRAGATVDAREALLRRASPLAVRLQDHLDELNRLTLSESRELLAAADSRLARTPVLEAILAITLLLGILGIYWTVRRTIDGQRRELDAYLARIEASNRDLDAFAGRIAHDLRNALAPLGVSASSLRHAAGRPDVVGRIAAQIHTSVQRSSLLIEGLLGFSRAADAGAGRETTALRQTIDGALDELTPLAERVDARIDVDLPEAEVRCAPGLLHIVAVNLIGNALKFLDGQPERRVVVRATAENGTCELIVADTGPGIPADALPRIFEPFYRVPGTETAGTGIGLATVHRIVEARGGTVTVESRVSQGSVFRVRLPLRAVRGLSVPATGVSV